MLWFNRKESEIMKLMSETFAAKKELESIKAELEIIKDVQLEITTGIKILKWATGLILTLVSIRIAMAENVLKSASYMPNNHDTEDKELKIILPAKFTDNNRYELYNKTADF